MAFQRVENTVEIDVNYTQNGEPLQNTFYARFGGAYSLSNLVALAAAVDAHISTIWLPLQTGSCDYASTDVIGLNAENDFFASNNNGAGPGTDLSEGLPNNATVSIKKSSGLSGRSARGRNFWIGTPTNKLASNENFLDFSYGTFIEDALDGVRGVIDAEFNWDAVLVSRFQGGAKRPEGVTFPWLSSTLVNLAMDSQRGRLSN
ncbi:hypothetical protein LCGC14_2599380 [marine sediment metagenome]|uniref:Uncharacterized protein n=1 Tax=marine sediment metagenome TaxID=412755 RepID=A0A0F9AWY2_9ZZZZ